MNFQPAAPIRLPAAHLLRRSSQQLLIIVPKGGVGELAAWQIVVPRKKKCKGLEGYGLPRLGVRTHFCTCCSEKLRHKKQQKNIIMNDKNCRKMLKKMMAMRGTKKCQPNMSSTVIYVF